ncbi:hypothetical protein RvY_13477 [Ramazzottius varieornatus]|uniref:EB domain-containing protein n=1 Tax=Ramazzottius varieornatus TaxID=947166 RepID=A0A1D1VS16_RAMVA|nr:hypothetical protein RvY_13477 [Ramazzottius varieornatus]
MARLVVLILLSLTSSFAAQFNNNGNNGGNGQQWNPFQNPFSFQNAPPGFGQFPSFGPNSGFGNFGSFGSGFGGNNNNGGNANNRNTNPSPSSGFGNSGNWGGFQDFSPVFDNFRKQFATQFPGFGFGGTTDQGNTGMNTGNPAPSAGTGNQPSTSDGVPLTPVPSPTPATSTSRPVNSGNNNGNNVQNPAPVAVVVSPTPTQTGGSITVTNRNCSQPGQVVGISPNSNDECGTAECECFQGVYFCYSTCNPPPAGQTCTPNMANGVCPTYDNCGPIANSSSGNAEMFRCTGGSVHPAVCWLYEILFGKLTEPLGFFESVQTGCPLASQCICGSNGFVQPAPLRQEDFKTPANNLVYPRSTPGNKGTFASS